MLEGIQWTFPEYYVPATVLSAWAAEMNEIVLRAQYTI